MRIFARNYFTGKLIGKPVSTLDEALIEADTLREWCKRPHEWDLWVEDKDGNVVTSL